MYIRTYVRTCSTSTYNVRTFMCSASNVETTYIYNHVLFLYLQAWGTVRSKVSGMFVYTHVYLVILCLCWKPSVF